MLSLKQKIFDLTFALTQLALVGWLDYITSYEVSLAIFYYIPIAYAAWVLGGGWGFGFSVLGAVTLTWSEIASGRHYSHDWIVVEVTGMRLLGLSFVAFSFSYFKRAIFREREKVRRLEGLVTFCTCCHKLRDDEGNWTNLASFLRDNKGVESEAKICPTCAREVYATGGEGKAVGR